LFFVQGKRKVFNKQNQQSVGKNFGFGRYLSAVNAYCKPAKFNRCPYEVDSNNHFPLDISPAGGLPLADKDILKTVFFTTGNGQNPIAYLIIVHATVRLNRASKSFLVFHLQQRLSRFLLQTIALLWQPLHYHFFAGCLPLELPQRTFDNFD
jgi:hypothetical protein